MVLQRTCNIVHKSCIHFINNYYSNTLFDFLSFLGYPKSEYNFVAYKNVNILQKHHMLFMQLRKYYRIGMISNKVINYKYLILGVVISIPED